jgi:pilus assembly protein CpaE
MDDVSADAYTKKHSSGLRLLAAPPTHAVRPEDIQIDQLDALLNMFLSNNDYVVADVPNRLDAATEFVLGRADKIVLVVQQTLPHVQDATRLTQLLTNDLRISRNRIDVAVNRFSKDSLVELRDIRRLLRQDKLITIPNQYKLAAESINSGVPVADISKNSPLARGIRSLRETFEASESKPPQNILARALPNILRS